MVLECVTWVPRFWYDLQSFLSSLSLSDASLAHDNPLYIPDDVVVNILSRLPVEHVMPCRRVCKKWCALISSSYFVELHMKRRAIATPHSLFMNWGDRVNSLKAKNPKFLNFLYDDHKMRGIVTKVRSKKLWNHMAKFEPTLVGSCDGLLLFVARYIDRNNKDFPPSSFRAFVSNPVTQELVVLHTPFQIQGICGIYRDTLTREYKVVFSDYYRDSISFYKFSLKSMQYEMILETKDYVVRVHYPYAVPMNGSLHWMVNRTNLENDNCVTWILAFNTNRQEIDFRPHPGSSKSYCCEGHEHMHLVGTTENLWLFNVLFEDKIDVWVLCDYDSWTWETRNSISRLWSLQKFPYPPNRTMYLYDVRVVAIFNNVKLLICWSHRGMFWYDLEKHTVSRALVFKDKASIHHNSQRLRCAPYIKTLARINPPEGE